jgi:hypothetical protein
MYGLITIFSNEGVVINVLGVGRERKRLNSAGQSELQFGFVSSCSISVVKSGQYWVMSKAESLLGSQIKSVNNSVRL